VEPEVYLILKNPPIKNTLAAEKNDPPFQGDRIGRIFAHWVTFNFGQLFAKYRNSPDYRATDFGGKS
jgi:hypothetical protein